MDRRDPGTQEHAGARGTFYPYLIDPIFGVKDGRRERNKDTRFRFTFVCAGCAQFGSGVMTLVINQVLPPCFLSQQVLRRN